MRTLDKFRKGGTASAKVLYWHRQVKKHVPTKALMPESVHRVLHKGKAAHKKGKSRAAMHNDTGRRSTAATLA